VGGCPHFSQQAKFHTVDKFPPTAQRKALLKFQAALNSSPSALRRDECGDPRITGTHGHIYAVPGTIERPHSLRGQAKRPAYTLFVMTETPRAWTFARRALSFAEVIADGDTEGALFMDRTPTPTEATAIRKATGIRKRRVLSEEHKALLRGHLAAQGMPSKTPEVHP
jgi:hypothetical protein